MQPLEGLYYFTQVVEHGGFARAARALGIPKSRLSRHLVALEAQLNVRLINRSTRRFAVTEVGREVYRHATAMLAEAEAALEAVEFARAEPRGTIRASCPVALAQSALATMLPDFLAKYPAIHLQMHVSNRRVDVVREGFDVALRVRAQPSGEDGLVMRAFGRANQLLVASPEYLARTGEPATPAASSIRGRGNSSERMARGSVRSTRRVCCATTSSCCAQPRSRGLGLRSCPRAWCARNSGAAR